MKLFKTKKAFVIILALIFTVLYLRHIDNYNKIFYKDDYQKEDISAVLQNPAVDDYSLIFSQTGVSPRSAEKLIKDGKSGLLLTLNELYFNTPEMEKEFVAYPVTVCERNKNQETPFADIQKGDIIVTPNTHTLDWRHGHCAMVIDEEKGILLEHMAIGIPSAFTYMENWNKYPSFVVLRYPDEKISEKAVEYAKQSLTGLRYNILAGVIKKDKSDEPVPFSSHCAHIIWQAYKQAGVDIDSTGGIFVTPENLAMSEALFFALRTVEVFMNTTTQMNTSQRSLELVMLCSMMLFFLFEAGTLVEREEGEISVSKYCMAGLATIAFPAVAVLPNLVVSLFVWCHDCEFVMMDVLECCVMLFAASRLLTLRENK